MVESRRASLSMPESALTFMLHFMRTGCAALSIIAQNEWIWLI